MNTFVLGDQTASQVAFLRSLVTRKDNTLLASFLQRASIALREEVRKLNKSQRDVIPSFLTLNHLTEIYVEKGIKVPQIESALLTIAQLAHYIGYAHLPIQVRGG
jgi:ABC-type uncharacterized transport system YnjBCD ATPase subunit